MASDKVKNLWGKDFRVVAQGLAETDVVIFVEKLMRSHRERVKQLDHIDSLHQLATKTVEDAERMSETIMRDAGKASEAESSRLTTEAQSQAADVLEKAQTAAQQLVEAARAQAVELHKEHKSRLQHHLSEIDSALVALKEAAERELSTRMRSHYIGKHLYQSVHFIPAFETLIKQVERGLSIEDIELPPLPELDSGEQDGTSNES